MIVYVHLHDCACSHLYTYNMLTCIMSNVIVCVLKQKCVISKCSFVFFFTAQFAEAYRNLQNTSRRHLNVHEPLIYDAVWLTAEALHTSLPILSESNLTLDTSQQKPTLISVLTNALENNSYRGLTVR